MSHETYQEMEKTCKRKDDGSPADLQQFTPEQIDEYCETINKVCSTFGNKWMVLEGVQIIRQLQEELVDG